jgi:hypothetical protein
MKTNPNDPASPVEVSNVDGNIIGNQTSQFSYFATGLTKREYFAGLAMQGIIGNSKVIYAMTSAAKTETARFAVELADALIEELNKSEQ